MTPANSKRGRWQRWFVRQCNDHFSEWLIAILLAILGGAISSTIAAAAWCYTMHAEVVGIRRDLGFSTQSLVEHRQDCREDSHEQWARIWENHKDVVGVSERVSRIEGQK